MPSFDLPVIPGGEPREYRFQIDLDGTTYELFFTWNDRAAAWYMDLLGLDGNYIRSGIKVVTGTPLLARISADDRPFGDIIAIDQEGEDLDAGLEDLGDRIVLIYGGNT
jgi:hypothetical protein